jgi:YihY family inner membrane protein
MNVIERGIRRVDAAQQRFTASAFVVGVVKKYGDDNGGTLASSLAHSALVSVFPLLLILSTVLGLVAAGNPELKKKIQDAAAQQVPLIGQQLTSSVTELHKSSQIGLVVGLAVLVWGATGLAQSALYTMEEVWNLPGPARPGFVQRLGRAALFIALLGGGVIVTTGLASLNTYVLKGFWAVILAELLAAAFNAGMYIGAFRALTPKGVPTRRLLPGAITGGIMWTALQVLGSWLVHHYLHSNSVYGIFGIVLGLMAWIYLAVQVTVYAAEINVVLARRLWPRSIVQPPLTEADRASMALQALQNQRRPEQHVEVTFDDREPAAPPPDRTGPAGTPRTPDEVAPPAEDRAAAAEVTVPEQRAEPELPAGRDRAQ